MEPKVHDWNEAWGNLHFSLTASGDADLPDASVEELVEITSRLLSATLVGIVDDIFATTEGTGSTEVTQSMTYQALGYVVGVEFKLTVNRPDLAEALNHFLAHATLELHTLPFLLDDITNGVESFVPNDDQTGLPPGLQNLMSSIFGGDLPDSPSFSMDDSMSEPDHGMYVIQIGAPVPPSHTAN
jgi:hypothetical protein